MCPKHILDPKEIEGSTIGLTPKSFVGTQKCIFCSVLSEMIVGLTKLLGVKKNYHHKNVLGPNVSLS